MEGNVLKKVPAEIHTSKFSIYLKIHYLKKIISGDFYTYYTHSSSLPRKKIFAVETIL